MNIYIEADIEAAKFSILLDKILSPATFKIVPSWSNCDAVRAFDYYIVLTPNSGDFCMAVDLPVPLAEDTQVVRRISRSISAFWHCDVVCDGAEFGDDDSPYWSLMFRDGVPFLVEDSNADFTELRKKHLTVVREILRGETVGGQSAPS